MTKRNSRLPQLVWISLAALLSPSALAARDHEFDDVVHRIESHYHQHPLRHMGLVSFIANRSHTEGVRNMKIAIFDDLDPARYPTDKEFESILQGMADSDMRPLIRTSSHRDGEQTCIYVREAGKDYDLLLVTLEREEATVIQMRLDPKAMNEWVDEPEKKSRKEAHASRQHEEP